MNYLDIVLVLVTLLFIYMGLRLGFIRALATVLCITLPFLPALCLYKSTAALIGRSFSIRAGWELPAAFFSLYLAAFILLFIALPAILRRLPPRFEKSRTNRWAGIVPGFIAGFMAALVTAKFALFSVDEQIAAQARHGALAAPLLNAAEWIDEYTGPVFGPRPGEQLAAASIHETEARPVQTTAFSIRPDLEKEMLSLVNNERVNAGLRPLQADPRLQLLARAHAADMFLRGYFSHNTPDGKTPFTRMDAAGVHYTTAGENLASSASVQRAHTGLMNSPGHRENIMNPAFGRLGIGIQDGGKKGLMIAQEFRD